MEPRVVLLVEPNASLSAVIAGVLKQEGIPVLTATSADEALAFCREIADIHLLVTDIFLPGIGAAELAQRVANHIPGIQILFLSSLPEDALRKQGITGKVLQKPIALRGLVTEVRHLLGKP